jgi:hypothetical protein
MSDQSFKAKLSDFFTQPKLPPRALSIGRKEIAVADVRWKKGSLVVSRAAVGAVPDGAIEPSFEGLNVRNKAELTKAIGRVITSAGLAGQKRWSLVIPQSACRTFILDLEQAPPHKKELAQMIEWKVERFVGLAASELTIAVQALRSAGPSPRFFVVVARSEVISSYESACSELGLRVGYVVPANVAEAGWLLMKAGEGDAMLVSLENDLLSMVFARAGDLLATRTVTCSPGAVIDEVHRTLVYYQDKLSGNRGAEEPGSEGAGEPGTPSTTLQAPGSALQAPNGSHQLKLVVLINHNVEREESGTGERGSRGAGEPGSGGAGENVSLPSPSAPLPPGLPASFGSQVEALCRELFPPQSVPSVYSLHEQKLEQDPSLKLSRLAAAVGIASAGK